MPDDQCRAVDDDDDDDATDHHCQDRVLDGGGAGGGPGIFALPRGNIIGRASFDVFVFINESKSVIQYTHNIDPPAPF